MNINTDRQKIAKKHSTAPFSFFIFNLTFHSSLFSTFIMHRQKMSAAKTTFGAVE